MAVTNSAGNANQLRVADDGTALTGNLSLDASTATAGNILKGGNPFISNYGFYNTFIGESAGNFTMTGYGNTAIGFQALINNTTGINNTASGFQALINNTTGNSNTATGDQALLYNTTGFGNTANGESALSSNTTGGTNTAIGYQTLTNNTVGGSNTAGGRGALRNNTTGNSNTAGGDSALFSNTTGSSNIALGASAGYNLTTGNNNIMIGNVGVADEAGTIRIGGTQTQTFIAGIAGATASDGFPVYINSSGQLGTLTSSRRFKDDIADMAQASSGLMKLRPVTFHYKSDHNPAGRALQYGLIAEEVAEVYPGLVAHSSNGRVETVMYQYLAPMLLNEYQKQQRTIDGQAALAERQAALLSWQTERIAELERERRTQAAQIAGLQQSVARVVATMDKLQRNATVTAGLEMQ